MTSKEHAQGLVERLDWMKINGTNDLKQWVNFLAHELDAIKADAYAAGYAARDKLCLASCGDGGKVEISGNGL